MTYKQLKKIGIILKTRGGKFIFKGSKGRSL